MLRGATRMALSCLTLLGAMLPVACVYEQIPEAYDEADTYIHLNLISSETNTRGVSDEHHERGQSECRVLRARHPHV